MKPQKKNLLTLTKIFIFSTVVIIFLLSIFLLLMKSSESNIKKNIFLKYSTEVNTSIISLDNNIDLLYNYNKIDFEILKKEKRTVNSIVTNLTNLNKQHLLAKKNFDVINNIDFLWKDILFDINSLLDSEEEITNLHETLESIQQLTYKIKNNCKNIVEDMLAINISTNKISLVQQVIWSADRLDLLIESYVKGLKTKEFSPAILEKEIANMFKLINSLKNGNIITQTTKIEDKEILSGLSKININLHQIDVLLKSIDKSFSVLLQMNSIAAAIKQSLLQFNDYLAKLNEILLNNETNNTIYTSIYIIICILVILSIYVAIVLIRLNSIKTTTYNKQQDAALAKLVTELDSLSAGNVNIKFTEYKLFMPLIQAINKYKDTTINAIRQKDNLLQQISNKLSVIDTTDDKTKKYNELKNKCINSIKQTIENDPLIIQSFYQQEKNITSNLEQNKQYTEELVTLITTLTNNLDSLNNTSYTADTEKKSITVNYLQQAVGEINNSIDVFKINTEIKLSQLPTQQGININFEHLDEIQQKVIELSDKLDDDLVTDNKIIDRNIKILATEQQVILQSTIKEMRRISIALLQSTNNDIIKINSKEKKNHTQSSNNSLNAVSLLEKAIAKLLNDRQQMFGVLAEIKNKMINP